jgi:hypothetical protein
VHTTTTATFEEETWLRRFPGWLGEAPGFYAAESVVVTDIGLELSLRSDVSPPTINEGDIFPECDCEEGANRTISMGLVMSKEQYLYGYFEIEATLPQQASASLWLQGKAAEISVFQTNTINPATDGIQRQTVSGAHCFTGWPAGWDVGAASEGPAAIEAEEAMPEAVQESLSDGRVHTFGLDWQENGTRYFVDGILVRTIQVETDSVATCLNTPMQAIVSISLPSGLPKGGSHHDGRESPSTLSGEMMTVKSFKYSKQKSDCTAPPTATSSSTATGPATSTTPAASCLELSGAKACKRVDSCRWNNKKDRCVTRAVTDAPPTATSSSTSTVPTTSTTPAASCLELSGAKACKRVDSCRWNNKKERCVIRAVTDAPATDEPSECDGAAKRKFCIAIEGCKWNRSEKVCSSL